MLKRIEEKLDNSPMLCAIVKGVSMCLGILFVVTIIITIILVFAHSVAWLICVILSALACGICFGVWTYLFDNY